MNDMNIKYSLLVIVCLLLFISASHKDKVKDSKRMNVLFIGVDDLRPELGCYGIDYIITPNIDKLASEGRVFNNHFVHSAICVPSRIALLSGKRNFKLSYWKEIRESNVKSDSIASLPQLFKESGYMTVCVGKISHEPGGVVDSLQAMHEVPNSWNKSYAPVGEWGDPWSAFFAYAGGKAKRYGYGRGNDTYKHYPFEAADVPDNGYPDGLNAEEAIAQLRQLKDTSFFLAVGFYKPHMPFNAPKKYWDMYDADKIPESAFNHIPEGITPNLLYGPDDKASEPRRYRWPNDTSRYVITKDRSKILKHGYAACVSYIDAQIGKIMTELKKLGLDKNTIVVLWGDHGWQLGDYGIWGKDTNFDIALRSPLIVKLPGVKDQGISTNSIVETVDIFPTLADICGLPVPDYINSNGSSFKRVIHNPDIKIKDYSYSKRDFFGHKGTTVRNEQYRLMINTDSNGDTTDVALFDNFEKPIPHTNIAKQKPEIVEHLKLKLTKNNSTPN